LQIGGFQYRQANYSDHDLQTIGFGKSTLDYKPIRRLAYRNPILPNGPVMRCDYSAFSAVCLVIVEMAGLEELSMEVDCWTESIKQRHIQEIRKIVSEGFMLDLGTISGLKLRKFDVTFTKKTLQTMGWNRQPFVNGVRRRT
jgi:hypothetical protein